MNVALQKAVAQDGARTPLGEINVALRNGLLRNLSKIGFFEQVDCKLNS